jgi:hypothetical protein
MDVIYTCHDDGMSCTADTFLLQQPSGWNWPRPVISNMADNSVSRCSRTVGISVGACTQRAPAAEFVMIGNVERSMSMENDPKVDVR